MGRLRARYPPRKSWHKAAKIKLLKGESRAISTVWQVQVLSMICWLLSHFWHLCSGPLIWSSSKNDFPPFDRGLTTTEKRLLFWVLIKAIRKLPSNSNRLTIFRYFIYTEINKPPHSPSLIVSSSAEVSKKPRWMKGIGSRTTDEPSPTTEHKGLFLIWLFSISKA